MTFLLTYIMYPRVCCISELGYSLGTWKLSCPKVNYSSFSPSPRPGTLTLVCACVGGCVQFLFIALSPILLPEKNPENRPAFLSLPLFPLSIFKSYWLNFLKAFWSPSRLGLYHLLPEWCEKLLAGPVSSTADPKFSLHSTSRVVPLKLILALLLYDISSLCPQNKVHAPQCDFYALALDKV